MAELNEKALKAARKAFFAVYHRSADDRPIMDIENEGIEDAIRAYLAALSEQPKDEGWIEDAARKLFPDDYHDGSDCRSEWGREGQPCQICAGKIEAWKDRIALVRSVVQP